MFNFGTILFYFLYGEKEDFINQMSGLQAIKGIGVEGITTRGNTPMRLAPCPSTITAQEGIKVDKQSTEPK